MNLCRESIGRASSSFKEQGVVVNGTCLGLVISRLGKNAGQVFQKYVENEGACRKPAVRNFDGSAEK